MRNIQPKHRGFTLIEILVVVAILGLLLSIAIANYHNFSENALDRSAQSDYRNIKVAWQNVIADSNTPTRVAIRRAVGPTTLPAPLNNISLSLNVEASIVYTARYRQNRTPLTNTTINVYHRDGTVRYLYVEQNGVVTEQEIALGS